MIDLASLLDYPTAIDGVAETEFRVFHTLELVKSLLQRGTPPAVVLDMIEAIERLPALEGWADPERAVQSSIDRTLSSQGACQLCGAALDNVTTGISVVHTKDGNKRVCGSCARTFPPNAELLRARRVS